MMGISLEISIDGTTEFFSATGEADSSGRVEFVNGAGSDRLGSLFAGEKTPARHLSDATGYLDKNLKSDVHYTLKLEVKR